MAVFEKNRKRRVIYNDDGDQKYETSSKGPDAIYDYTVVDEKTLLEARTTLTFGTHVDTYVWCVGNGADPPREFSKGKMFELWPWLESHDQVTDMIVAGCHRAGMEVWGSLRMNDLHDAWAETLEVTNEPIKAQHPEYLMEPEQSRKLPAEWSEHYLWTALNYALPEVRRYRLEFIASTAARHDFDGYELDFTRTIYSFRPGEERAHAPEMTELIRQVRRELNEIGKKRGRPYLLCVHVCDSPRLSLELGLDVETWAAEGLVDVLVVGTCYLPYTLELGEWLALGRQYGLPVYPAQNTNVYEPSRMGQAARPEAWNEAIRGCSAYYLQEGADGHYLFNVYCMEDKTMPLGPMPHDQVYAPLKEIGDLASLAGKDKLYSIQPQSDTFFSHFGCGAAQLPIALESVERRLDLRVGPDAADPKARFRISFLASGATANRHIWLRLNHKLLVEPSRQGDWYHLDVPAGVMRAGQNDLSIWCDGQVWSNEQESANNPIIVQRVLVHARYGD